MRRRHPRVASLDEVRITRHGHEAVLEYADEKVWTTTSRLGPGARYMTDRWNECVLVREQAPSRVR